MKHDMILKQAPCTAPGEAMYSRHMNTCEQLPNPPNVCSKVGYLGGTLTAFFCRAFSSPIAESIILLSSTSPKFRGMSNKRAQLPENPVSLLFTWILTRRRETILQLIASTLQLKSRQQQPFYPQIRGFSGCYSLQLHNSFVVLQEI